MSRKTRRSEEAPAPKPVLLSLGSINADFQVRVGEPLEEGRTLIARDFARLSGGKAANVALLAHRLGRAVVLIGRVGDDDLAEQALEPLRAAGLDLDQVLRAPGASTAVSVICVPPSGKKSIVLAPNANDDWNEAQRSRALRSIAGVPDGSILVVDCEIPVDLVERASEAACSRGLRIVLDPSPAGRVGEAVLGRSFAVTANPKEAETLTGVAVKDPASAAEAAGRLCDLGVALPCVKLPDGGCVIRDGKRALLVPSPSFEVVDTTGAGDAFAAALAVALLDGFPVAKAAGFAVVASSLAVTAYGSQASYPTREAIEPHLEAVHRKTRAL